MRGITQWVFAVVLILVIAWGGLWLYTEVRLRDGMANEITLYNNNYGGNVVTYDSISMGANPFTASATMNNVRFSPNQPGENAPLAMSIAQVKVWIDAFNPLVMHFGLPSQIVLTTPRGAGSINFGSFAANAGLDPSALFNRTIYPLTSENLAIQNMDVTAGGNNVSLLHIDGITLRNAFNRSAGPDQTALTVQESYDGIALSPMLVLLGHVPFGGKITHIGFNMTLSGPIGMNKMMEQFRDPQVSEQQRLQLFAQAMHGWAAAGGNGKASLTLVLGPSTLSANGTVAFDASAQPSGTADITADHLDAFSDAITTAYPQAQQSITQAETQLSPYLSTTDAGGQVLNVNVAYGKPGVLVNGKRMADMPPLDWTKLETLLAAAPVAAP